MTNEKRELLEELQYLIDCTGDCESDAADPALKEAIKKIRSLIETPPPKHTQCENCLDDLDKEENKFAYCDKCWQDLLADLKKARPKVSIKEIDEWINGIFILPIEDRTTEKVIAMREANRNYLVRQLRSKGVEIASPGSNADKVSGKEAKDGKEKD